MALTGPVAWHVRPTAATATSIARAGAGATAASISRAGSRAAAQPVASAVMPTRTGVLIAAGVAGAVAEARVVTGSAIDMARAGKWSEATCVASSRAGDSERPSAVRLSRAARLPALARPTATSARRAELSATGTRTKPYVGWMRRLA